MSNRRQFLKTSVASAGALAALSSGVLSSSNVSAHTGTTSTTGFIKVPTDGTDVRGLNLQQAFNRRWFGSSVEFIYLCFNSEGVMDALKDIIPTYGSAFTIRGGGHCYENFVFNRNVRAVVDISPMNSIEEDSSGAVVMEAGGTNWEAYKWLSKRGLCLPAGSCYSVGLGGHICGGGYGVLSRLFGLTVDWLSAVTVVTVNASGVPSIQTVSASSSTQEEKDLFWVHTGGGGGNFGVITAYHFDNLPTAPEIALVGVNSYDWSSVTPSTFESFLDEYADVISTATVPREFFGLLKLNHISAGGQFALVYQLVNSPSLPNAADLETAATDITSRLDAIVPSVASTSPIIGHPAWLGASAAKVNSSIYSFYEALQFLNGSGVNQRGKYKSAYMKKAFPADQSQKIYDWLHDVTTVDQDYTTQTLVQVDTYAGAINDRTPTDTPIPQRDSIMKLQYQAYWDQHDIDIGAPDCTQGIDLVNWMNAAYNDIYSATGGFPDPTQDKTDTVDGCYYNYPDSELANTQSGRDFALELYFGSNFKTNTRNLQQIKATWDPGNYFNHPQSIPLP